MDEPSPERRGRRRSPSLAALLSFFWPGLGQAYLGRRRAAVVFTVPALLVTLLVLWRVVERGPAVFGSSFLIKDVVVIAMVLTVATGLWRLLAVSHAFWPFDLRRGRAGEGPRIEREPVRSGRGDRAAVGVLLAAVVAMHGVALGYVLMPTYEFDREVFQNYTFEPLSPETPTGSLPAGQTPSPVVTVAPAITPAPGSTRVTILLIGTDSAPTRTEHLNDTLLLISADTAKKTVGIVSVPRDTAQFEYYWGGKAPDNLKINSLMGFTRRGKVKSPDDPMTTLVKEIGYLVGVPVNYYAAVDLVGFAGLIDKVGGVDINSAEAINDPSYDWLDGSPLGFKLSAGKHHLNGRLTLAYVRSRHGVGGSDYVRSSRQQEVLIALEKRLTKPENLAKLPDILKVAQPVIRTNFPAEEIPDMVDFAQSLPDGAISQVVLGPPYSLPNATPGRAWTSCLYQDKVAEMSVKFFGTDSRYYGQTFPHTC